MERMTLKERVERRNERRIRRYYWTAARKLRDMDFRAGLNPWAHNVDYEAEIRPYVERAMTHVAAIHVPRHAVRLYNTGEEK